MSEEAVQAAEAPEAAAAGTEEKIEAAAAEAPIEAPASNEAVSYQAVEKEGTVTAIWEMQGQRHLRTIDPRSRQGQDILRLYTTEHHDETGEAAAS